MLLLNKIFKNLLLLTLSLVICLIVAEVFVRAFIQVRNVGPSFTEYDDIFGKKTKRSFSTTRITPEFSMKFHSNSLGYRGPEVGLKSPSPILFIGDSMTMGYGVDDELEFPALVRKSLVGTEGSPKTVINAGIGDNGNGRWLKILRGPAINFNPGLVVLQVSANDPMDNISEGLFTLSQNGTLIENEIGPKSRMRKLQELIEFFPVIPDLYLVGLGRQISLSGLNPEDDVPITEVNTDDQAIPLELTRALVGTSIQICKRNNWPVILLIAGVSKNDPLRDEIVTLASGENIPVIIVPEKEKRPDLYFAIDGHWNPGGHELAAQLVLEQITTGTVN